MGEAATGRPQFTPRRNCVPGESLARHRRVLDRNAVRFLDANRELQRVDRIETEAAGTKEERLRLDLIRPHPEHTIIHEKLSDIIEGNLGHDKTLASKEHKEHKKEAKSGLSLSFFGFLNTPISGMTALAIIIQSYILPLMPSG